MIGAWDFVAYLARAGKSYQEIKETVDTAYGLSVLEENRDLRNHQEGQGRQIQR
jgi:hypothetical protein